MAAKVTKIATIALMLFIILTILRIIWLIYPTGGMIFDNITKIYKRKKNGNVTSVKDIDSTQVSKSGMDAHNNSSSSLKKSIQVTVTAKKTPSVADPRIVSFCDKYYLVKQKIGNVNVSLEVSNKTIWILKWNKKSYFYKENFEKCEYKNCRITYNRGDFRKSLAVVFDPQQYLRMDCMPPKLKGQIWIFLATETPVYTCLFEKSLFGNKFNWTWTYRRDSDIPAYFGAIEPKNKTEIEIHNITKRKTKLLSAIISHCSTDGQREKYLAKLKSYIGIDVYGLCGPLRISKGQKHLLALRLLNTTYKFYLSFENSLCRDYITEKVLRVLRAYIVPVVRGSVFYNLYVPSNSYIDTQNFTNPEAVAKYLLKVGNNTDLYNEFYEWRNSYAVSTGGFRWNLCELCKRLNLKEHYKRLYEDIQEWWSGTKNNSFCNSKPNDFSI